MTDEPQGFTPAPFPQLGDAATTPPAAEPAPKKRGGRRGPRKPKPDKPVRKPKRSRRIGKMIKNARVRQAAAAASAPPPAGVKLDLATAAAIFGGMSNDDSKLVSGMVITLAALSKEQRKRILAALARVFA